jgi:hypothetical protein
MALDINGFAVLRAIGGHVSTFSDVETEVNKQARSLVVKLLAGKAIDLRKTRETLLALGAGDFALIVDGLPDAKVKTLVTKLDKYNPGIKTESAAWRRQLLAALANGSVEPTEKAPTTKKASSKTSKPNKSPERQTGARYAKESEFVEFRSAGARRKR